MQNVLKVLTVLASYVYPAYATYRCLNVKDRSKNCIWQIYWIMYAVYASIVALTDQFIWWLPLYEEIKFLFICWLLPTIGCGSSDLYNRFLTPFLNQNKRVIDSKMNDLCSAIYNYSKFVVYLIYKILQYAAQRLGLVQSNNDLGLTESLRGVIAQFLEKRDPNNKRNVEADVTNVDDVDSDDESNDKSEDKSDNESKNAREDECEEESDNCDGEEDDVDVDEDLVKQKRMLAEMTLENRQVKDEESQMEKFNFIMRERNGRLMSEDETET